MNILYILFGIYFFGIQQVKLLHIKDPISNLEIIIRKLGSQRDQTCTERQVAFTAMLSKTYTSTKDNEKVVFDKMITNTGNAYNPVDGVFTAPCDGLYVFDWTVLTNPGKVFDTEIVVNGVVKGYNAVDTAGTKLYASGSALVTLELKDGEKVWIKKHRNAGNLISGLWSSFSGWKK